MDIHEWFLSMLCTFCPPISKSAMPFFQTDVMQHSKFSLVMLKECYCEQTARLGAKH